MVGTVADARLPNYFNIERPAMTDFSQSFIHVVAMMRRFAIRSKS
jgi:hypothetical protein